jgi:hypothetical protein
MSYTGHFLIQIAPGITGKLDFCRLVIWQQPDTTPGIVELSKRLPCDSAGRAASDGTCL